MTYIMEGIVGDVTELPATPASDPMLEDSQNKNPQVVATTSKVEEPAPASEGKPTEMTRLVQRRGRGMG